MLFSDSFSFGVEYPDWVTLCRYVVISSYRFFVFCLFPSPTVALLSALDYIYTLSCTNPNPNPNPEPSSAIYLAILFPRPVFNIIAVGFRNRPQEIKTSII